MLAKHRGRSSTYTAQRQYHLICEKSRTPPPPPRTSKRSSLSCHLGGTCWSMVDNQLLGEK